MHISQTRWVLPSRVLRQSPLVLFVLLCVAPAPFFVASLSFFWQNANLAGRFAGRLCCWVFVLVWLGHDSPHLKPQCFILFLQLLPLLSPSGPSLRARSATTGKKKGGSGALRGVRSYYTGLCVTWLVGVVTLRGVLCRLLKGGVSLGCLSIHGRIMLGRVVNQVMLVVLCHVMCLQVSALRLWVQVVWSWDCTCVAGRCHESQGAVESW